MASTHWVLAIVRVRGAEPGLAITHLGDLEGARTCQAYKAPAQHDVRGDISGWPLGGSGIRTSLTELQQALQSGTSEGKTE